MKTRSIILLCLLAVLVLGGAYAYHQNSVREQIKREALLEAERRQQNLESFETFLNDFLKNVYEEVVAYRQRKQVLTSLVQPENLRSAEYVAENEMIGESTIIAMQLQMDRIMGLFEKADANYAALVKEFPEEQQKDMQERWSAELTQQSEMYMTYFEQEQEILEAYRQLLGLYKSKREMISVDLTNNKIMFTNAEDQQFEADLKSQITEAQRIQRDMMQEYQGEKTP